MLKYKFYAISSFGLTIFCERLRIPFVQFVFGGDSVTAMMVGIMVSLSDFSTHTHKKKITAKFTRVVWFCCVAWSVILNSHK